jgi:hypothetical protein
MVMGRRKILRVFGTKGHLCCNSRARVFVMGNVLTVRLELNFLQYTNLEEIKI